MADAASTSDLQSQINADNEAIAILNQKIAEYQAKLQEIGSDKKTLQAAINALDVQKSKVETQVAVTQHQINSTQLQIQQLGSQISTTEQTIATDQAALEEFLQNIQKNDDMSLLAKVLSSGDMSQFWDDLNSTLQAQSAIREKTQELQQQEADLASAQTAEQEKQDALNSQKQALSSQQKSLASTVNSKNQLLAETKAQESTYQKLLSQAQAELESYSAFTQNAGGANLLPHQTVCDDWGCYYNQRDSSWGGYPLNGTKYTLASDGCLVTAMAMVMTHYGYKDVTPVTINSDPGNFAAYYPAYLLMTISVDGVSATRKTAQIDATLATGAPVIVGLRVYGGTHFVVLTQGRAGNYIMRDPYVSNGKDIKFTSKYSMKEIFSIAKVQIS
ncbi:MAG TPA: hypothetical protein VFK07_02645 [Candidatus Paceibacterota bacterium]|nr:hypothetical protein [Candidatus Paceibacterota bacterium]